MINKYVQICISLSTQMCIYIYGSYILKSIKYYFTLLMQL